jgi:hypothetical protein
MKGLTVKPREIATPPPVIDLMTALKRSLTREAGSKHTAPKKGARSAPAGPLAARSRGSETESTDRRRAHHSRPKAAKTSNCLIRTPFLRHLSRRVVRVDRPEAGRRPRYRKFESIPLQRRVTSELACHVGIIEHTAPPATRVAALMDLRRRRSRNLPRCGPRRRGKHSRHTPSRTVPPHRKRQRHAPRGKPADLVPELQLR